MLTRQLCFHLLMMFEEINLIIVFVSKHADSWMIPLMFDCSRTGPSDCFVGFTSPSGTWKGLGPNRVRCERRSCYHRHAGGGEGETRTEPLS